MVKKAVSLATGTEYAVKIMPIAARLRYRSSSEDEDGDGGGSRSSGQTGSSSSADGPDQLTFDEIMNEIGVPESAGGTLLPTSNFTVFAVQASVWRGGNR